MTTVESFASTHPTDTLYPADIPFCVAFDRRLGQTALAEGRVYDADIELVYRALKTGNLPDDEIARRPVVFMKKMQCEGSLTNTDGDGKVVRILVNCDDGNGQADTQTIAHESRHLADLLHVDDGRLLSRRETRHRKFRAAAKSAIYGAGYYSLLTSVGNFVYHTPVFTPNFVVGGFSVWIADLTLSKELVEEYIDRPHEIRAREAGSSMAEGSALLVNGEKLKPSSEPHQKHPFRDFAKSLKEMHIPRFRL